MKTQRTIADLEQIQDTHEFMRVARELLQNDPSLAHKVCEIGRTKFENARDPDSQKAYYLCSGIGNLPNFGIEKQKAALENFKL